MAQFHLALTTEQTILTGRSGYVSRAPPTDKDTTQNHLISLIENELLLKEAINALMAKPNCSPLGLSQLLSYWTITIDYQLITLVAVVFRFAQRLLPF
jgi:hypothetical protein